jgi:hypothetical protein
MTSLMWFVALSSNSVWALYCPTSDIAQLSRIAMDNEEFQSNINNAADSSKEIYIKGKNSCATGTTLNNGRTRYIDSCPATTLQSLNSRHTGGLHFEAYSSFYGSNMSFDELILLTFNDTGSMGWRSGTFRTQIAKKAVLGLMNLGMHAQLAKALNLFQAQKYSEALKAWDESWAIFHGDVPKKCPYYPVSGRDKEFNGVQLKTLIPRLYSRGILSEEPKLKFGSIQSARSSCRNLPVHADRGSSQCDQVFSQIAKKLSHRSRRL